MVRNQGGSRFFQGKPMSKFGSHAAGTLRNVKPCEQINSLYSYCLEHNKESTLSEEKWPNCGHLHPGWAVWLKSGDSRAFMNVANQP